MYMDKHQLSKLASLNNEKANKFLLDFAITKKTEIEKSTSNEDIIETLEYLDVISYRVFKVVLNTCCYVLYKEKPIKPKIIFGNTKGESWSKVQSKALDLLRQIRYYELKKVTKIALEFSDHEDQNVKSTAVKLIQDIAEYNYRALPHVGINPQIFILNCIKKIVDTSDFESNFNPIKVVIEKVLDTSADMSIMTSPDTLTFTHGDLNGTDALKALRKKAIDLIFSIYKKSKNNLTRDTIVHLLEHASQLPMNSPMDSTIGKTVLENREYIIFELEKVMFDKKGTLLSPFSFCLAVEHFLYWYFIYHKRQDDIARPLYEKVIKNSEYEKFSKFVHDDSMKFEIGSGEMEKQNRLDVAEYIQNISVDKINNVKSELNLFATEIDVIGEWKFRNLQALVEKLGSVKPDFAFTLVLDAIKNKKPLSNHMFLAFLLRGIRLSKHYDIWDKAVDLILKTKNPNFVGAIPASLHIYADVYIDPVLRKEDILILENLTTRSKPFEFLQNPKISLNINFSIMNALRAVYALNPKKIENLIVNEINSGPQFLDNYFNTLSIYSGKKGGIDFSAWSSKNKKFLASKIIEIPVIDWHIDSLINNLYSEPVDIIRLFIERIKKESKRDKSMIDYFERNDRYEAVPFHMNDDLVEHVVNHRNYKAIVPEIVKASRSKDQVRHYDLAKLSKHFKVSPYSLLEALSIKGKVTDKTVRDVLGITYTFDGIDIEFAIKLASYTSNEKVLRRIAGELHSTGVVSGEYGIADSYRHKIEELEKYRDTKNKNVKKFVEMSIESLKFSEERSRKDAEKSKEKRRIDFETNS